ncbi:MAG: hypothetical protein M4579_006420 [Chaenotheca gracillima]|nr:MAG: hypothetical protein M4579_006420 [Chaenotheca gracillima]
MATSEETEALLRAPTNDEVSTSNRVPSSYTPLSTYEMPKEKSYKQQYGDLYFLRLAQLKPVVDKVAAEAWDGFQIHGEVVRRVDRVLDVRQGEFCWVTGTVYMDMPLKPNILDDISKEHWISAPPPREKYRSPNGLDQIMLEDESGRLRLIGVPISTELLVTGCIIAIMGTENANGDFEVIDLRVPDLPRQPQRWESYDSAGLTSKKSKDKGTRENGGKIAIVSGLGFSGNEIDSLNTDLLMEYLLGEATSPPEQASAIPSITRLIIAGNSITDTTLLPPQEDEASASKEVPTKKAATKKYGYDAASYNPAPTAHLDSFLATLLPTIPITLIPGATDPTNVSLPQQPMHNAIFPHSRAYASLPTEGKPTDGNPPTERGWFDSTTNPWEGDVQGWRMLGTGGQTVDDVFKYVESDDRIEMMERLLRWRCCAPTAPDTLWCYPFQTHDPFTIDPNSCPHLFFVGNQPKFDTALIEGPAGQTVRLIAVPKFKETGECILVDLEELGKGGGVEILKFDVFEAK